MANLEVKPHIDLLEILEFKTLFLKTRRDKNLSEIVRYTAPDTDLEFEIIKTAVGGNNNNNDNDNDNNDNDNCSFNSMNTLSKEMFYTHWWKVGPSLGSGPGA